MFLATAPVYPIDLWFHQNLETSTRKFLEIHLKLSESENADRAIGNQISDVNLEKLPKLSVVVKCKLTICFLSSWALNVDEITCIAISVHVNAIKAHHETAQWLEHPTRVYRIS